MPAENGTFTALDGGEVQVASAFPLGPVTSHVGVRFQKIGIAQAYLVAGAHGLAASLAESPQVASGMRFDEEYALDGATVRLGWGEPQVGPDGVTYTEWGPDGRLRHARVRMAIWSGGSYELHVLRYSGESDVLLAMFNELVISETTTGVVCAPKDRTATQFVEGPSVLIDVPGLGLLEVFQLTAPRVKDLPRFAGTSVAGGELFVRARDSEKRHFIMVGDTALTYLMPDHGVTNATLEQGLADLTVTWQAPAAR